MLGAFGLVAILEIQEGVSPVHAFDEPLGRDATEAAQGAIKHGFETVGLDEIYCIIYPENTRSVRVAERLGLEPLGTTKEYHDQELLFYKVIKP